MVTTRSKATSDPFEPLSLSKLARPGANPRRRAAGAAAAASDEDDHPLTPRTLAAALPAADASVRPATAGRAPFSHRLAFDSAEEASPSPAASDASSSGFTIAAVGAAAAVAPPAAAEPLPPAASAPPLPLAAAASPPPAAERPLPPPAAARPPPGERLLKPLPDVAVACTKLPDGPEPAAQVVEYPPRAELLPVEGDPAAAAAAAAAGMAAAEWTEVVAALALVRRLAARHSAASAAALEATLPLVVRQVRSLRSAVAKTALMAADDLLAAHGGALLPAAAGAEGLLAQLLLKAASNDKRFVVDEARRALGTAACALPAAPLLAALAPQLEHKNPRVRGQAAAVAAAAAERLAPAEAAAHGLPELVRAAALLVNDNTPEAREGAKRLGAVARGALADAGVAAALALKVPPPPAEGEAPARQLTPWEFFCQSTLGVAGAAPLLRAVE
jgi:hypothetical protein